MAAGSEVNVEVIYEDLLAEHKASQQQLQSKDEALKIFQKQLRESNNKKQILEQEIKQLHSQLARSQVIPTASPSSTSQPSTPSSIRYSSSGPGAGAYDTEREKHIIELEEVQEKNTELFRQIQLLEDEKEELTGERDYYSGKCANLVKCLEEERKSKPPSHSALQTLMEENRQIKLDLVDVQAERDQALSRIDRYKKAVERRKAKEANEDQPLQFAAGNKKQDLRVALRRISELESLANSLSESVKEKTISLSHQKRANKMLASRITELEHRLKVLEISGLWSSDDILSSNLPDPLLSSDLQNDTVSNGTTMKSTTIPDFSASHMVGMQAEDINKMNPFSELHDDDITESQKHDDSQDKNESVTLNRKSSSSEEDGSQNLA